MCIKVAVDYEFELASVKFCPFYNFFIEEKNIEKLLH